MSQAGARYRAYVTQPQHAYTSHVRLLQPAMDAALLEDPFVRALQV